MTRSGVAFAISSTLGLKKAPPMTGKLFALFPKKAGSCPSVSLTTTGSSLNAARISSQMPTRQAMRVGCFDSATVVWVASVKVSLVGEGVGGGLAAVVAVAEGAVGVEGHASVRRVAELGGGEGVALGVRVVGEDAGGGAVEDCDRAALGHGGAVVVGDRRVVHRRDRNRDGGRAAALGVGRAVRRAVVAGLVGEGVGGGLAAVVAVAEGAVGVEGLVSVGPVVRFGGGEGVGLGVRVVGEDAGGRAVEDGDRAALGHGGAVVVG